MALLSLDQVIIEACEIFAPADAPTRYYTAALSHAASFRKLYQRKNATTLRTVYLKADANRTVELPADYANWQMLGVTFPGWSSVRNLNYNGKLSLLTFDPSDTTPDFLTPPTSAESDQSYGSIDADSPSEHYLGFGAPVHADEFRIDPEHQRIVCSSRLPDSALLVLEYYGFGAEDGADIMLDPLAHEWAKNYIIERLFVQKKDWNSVAYYKAEALKAHSMYVEDRRTFGIGNVLNTKRAAAAQRWK